MNFNQRGFSLVELMVAMAIAGFAMAGIYGVYNAQVKMHVTQSVVVDNQQNLRNAMFIIQNFIRMAGYDPSRVARIAEDADADNKQRLGLFTASDFATLCGGTATGSPMIGGACAGGYSGIGTDGDSIAFTLDWNGDAPLVPTPPPNSVGFIEKLDTEAVAFYLDTTTDTIMKYGAEFGSRPLADNIDALLFRYFDQAGGEVLPSPPATTLTRTQLDSVRSVQVTITSIPPREASGAAGNKAATSLSALVKMRNSGLP